MKKGIVVSIIGGIIAIIIIGTIVVQFSSINDNELNENDNENIIDVDNDGVPDDVDPFIPPGERIWQTSGPFQIDKEKYALGELVLIRIGGLEATEKGQIAFLRPSNGTHYPVYITIPFDGSQKEIFNQYFKPALSRSTDTCSKEDLLGNWTVVFRGTNYNQLKFEIVDEIVPGDEEDYEKIIC